MYIIIITGIIEKMYGVYNNYYRYYGEDVRCI